MHIEPFATEQFYALYEFQMPHLLSVSDCESVTTGELLDLAGMSLSDFGQLHLGYTRSKGDPELRRAIADTYETVSVENVVVLTSPVEGIYLTMRTLLEPEDEAIVLMPAYDSLKNMAEHICKTHTWELVASENEWQLDFDALEKLINNKTKLIVVNFPHNPTGFLPNPEQFDCLINMAKAHGIWLFCDEMYRGLEFDDHKILPTVADRYENTIALSGLSKAHGLPGLRSGWLVIKDEQVREKLVNWKHYTTICPSAPSEFLALAALKAGEKLIERNKTIVKENLVLAEPFFERWKEFFTWRRPQSGSMALVGVDVASATDYCHTLAKGQGVLLLPSSCMGYGDKHVRFGFGRKSFEGALQHYETHLRHVL